MQESLGITNNQGYPEWYEFANCHDADPDIFFPEQGGNARSAKAICDKCAVRSECLEFAIANGEKFGIWGGATQRELRNLRRERRMQSNKDADAA